MAQTILPAIFTPARTPDNPGEYKFFTDQGNEIAGMIFCCPCGCGKRYAALFKFMPRNPNAYWTWNHDKEKPTLTPSIHVNGSEDACGWHGWLRGGEWIGIE